MDLSPQGFDLLFRREGKRNTVYLDSQGKPTCGVGHYDSNLVVGDVWTDEQVQDAFNKDSAWVKGCLSLVTKPLEQNQFDGLFSFIWNIGAGQWANSTMLRLLNEGAPAGDIARQFDRWHMPPEITSRRNAERDQFLGLQFEARIP